MDKRHGWIVTTVLVAGVACGHASLPLAWGLGTARVEASTWKGALWVGPGVGRWPAGESSPELSWEGFASALMVVEPPMATAAARARPGGLCSAAPYLANGSKPSWHPTHDVSLQMRCNTETTK